MGTSSTRIASWNVNSLNVRLPHLERWLQATQPDIVGLQETKLEDARFPREALEALGYACVFHGQRTYNGVALLARGGEPTEVQIGIPGFEDPQCRAIAATVGRRRIVNLYVVNGELVGSEKYQYKLRWIEAARGWLAAEAKRHEELVVMGDFNIAPADIDVHDPRRWHERIMCSSAEREALGHITALGLADSFRIANPDTEKAFTWWDYRLQAFPRGWGLRIDLLLVSGALAKKVRAGGIDVDTRGWERPSDHAPVWVELAP